MEETMENPACRLPLTYRIMLMELLIFQDHLPKYGSYGAGLSYMIYQLRKRSTVIPTRILI